MGELVEALVSIVGKIIPWDERFDCRQTGPADYIICIPPGDYATVDGLVQKVSGEVVLMGTLNQIAQRLPRELGMA